MSAKLSLYDFIQLEEMEQIEAYWKAIPVGSCTKMVKSLSKQIEDFTWNIGLYKVDSVEI